MTELTVGVVDVYAVRPLAAGWQVLALRRAPGFTRAGAWETIHGTMEPGERPEHAAVREVGEETGLAIERLYNVTCQPFYLHRAGVVQVAVVFCAFVREPAAITLGPEHEAWEWLSFEAAAGRFVWPREREALGHIRVLLGTGDAGAVEDVLRVI